MAQTDCVVELFIEFAGLASDHNGFSHQDPGFIDHLLNKKADVVRIYLPPDANTLSRRGSLLAQPEQSI